MHTPHGLPGFFENKKMQKSPCLVDRAALFSEVSNSPTEDSQSNENLNQSIIKEWQLFRNGNVQEEASSKGKIINRAKISPHCSMPCLISTDKNLEMSSFF